MSASAARRALKSVPTGPGAAAPAESGSAKGEISSARPPRPQHHELHAKCRAEALGT